MPKAPMPHNVPLPRAKTLWHLPHQTVTPGITRAVYARILTAANIPDADATIAGFRSLRAGQVGRLCFDHIAEKQEHQRA